MKKTVSLVYKNIYIYRLIMNFLYGMKYKKRFENIISLINNEEKDIVELCFGDIFIAKYAKKNNKNWKGFDINDSFVSYAIAEGFDATNKNILLDSIPKSDVCIMAGSLYHFIDNIEFVLGKMLKSSKKVIISEPIKNLSNNKYIGFFAKKSANAGNGEEEFRFTEISFLNILNQYKIKLSFEYEIIKKDRDILVVLKCS
jgi:hypothetical protein